ncbi:MAG: gliding motility-associated C-terminal domain-containing protein, partial [Bacteroidetes bacterium]|nr:gliding motility-associated C-terminal domain-containing protein [Bacteroidota bacterium]
SVTVTSGTCPSATDEITISFAALPDVELGSDISLCNGDSALLTPIITGGITPYIYSWGTCCINEPLPVSNPGHYAVTVIDGNGCTDTDTVAVIINDKPEVDLGGDQSVCEGNTLTLDAGAGFDTYQWTNGAVDQIISVGIAGSYGVVVTDTHGCQGGDTIYVSFVPVPDPTINDPGTFCTNYVPAQLSAIQTGGIWTGSGITDQDTGMFDPGLAGAGNHEIIYSFTGGCNASDTVFILVYGTPQTVAVTTGISCYGNSNGSIVLSVSGGASPYTFLWNTGATSEGLAALSEGSYSVTVSDNNGCSDIVSATVVSPAPLSLIYSVTDESCTGVGDGAINLTINGGTPVPSGEYSYYYTWSDGATIQNNTGLFAGEYSVTVTDKNDCTTEGSFTVIALTDICTQVPSWFVPNVFSPNNDGLNDLLYVRGGAISGMEFTVFDRWGQKVCELTSPDMGWDGTFKGKELESAVYIWNLHILFFDGSEISKQGTVVILR